MAISFHSLLKEIPKLNFNDYVLSKWRTGSRYICNPAPTDTDNDTMFLVTDIEKARQALRDDNWKEGGSGEKGRPMISFKKTVDGVLENYIVIDDVEHYQKWVTATELSKRLNLLKKNDRIELFGVIVDGNTLY